MIIGISEPCEIGSVCRIDLIDAPHFREDVPVLILREATREEYIQEHMSRGKTREKVEQDLDVRLSQFSHAKFYEVATD